jgi:hypothetical protein
MTDILADSAWVFIHCFDHIKMAVSENCRRTFNPVNIR